MTLVEDLDLRSYPPVHAVRADLLHRLGRMVQARSAYDEAVVYLATTPKARSCNDGEQSWTTDQSK